MPKNKRDELWFYEASARFFSSLLWAMIIIVSGTRRLFDDPRSLAQIRTQALRPNGFPELFYHRCAEVTALA